MPMSSNFAVQSAASRREMRARGMDASASKAPFRGSSIDIARRLAFQKRRPVEGTRPLGVKFRDRGVSFRPRGVAFRDGSIDLASPLGKRTWDPKRKPSRMRRDFDPNDSTIPDNTPQAAKMSSRPAGRTKQAAPNVPKFQTQGRIPPSRPSVSWDNMGVDFYGRPAAPPHQPPRVEAPVQTYAPAPPQQEFHQPPIVDFNAMTGEAPAAPEEPAAPEPQADVPSDLKREAVLMNNKGVEQYKNGRYTHALKFFNDALAADPYLATARENKEKCIDMIKGQVRDEMRRL